MNVCVLSGSPKGKESITFQTVLYLQKKFPNDNFETLHAGKYLRQYENDFTPAKAALQNCDLVLFCYPVYTFLVPSQLHRFIELIYENEIDLSGKFAAQITTSKHFYDTTAHAFICQNCGDLGLKYLAGLSADMEDLLKPAGQKDAENFWNLVQFRAQNNWIDSLAKYSAVPAVPDDALSRAHSHIQQIRQTVHSHFAQPQNAPDAANVQNLQKTEPDQEKNANSIALVCDLAEDDEKLFELIEKFRQSWQGSVKVFNLRKIRIDGGCLGCFNCAVSGKCVYKDGFDDFLRSEIQTCSAIVLGFSVKNHSMGALFKKYDDRQFCNGHRTVTMGMPFGYLVNRNLAAEPNLRMVIDGRAQVGGNFLAGIATTGEEIEGLCANLQFALQNRIVQPQMFLGIGGMKIFRDLIYVMAGFMHADYKFYKKHGFFDFPQKQFGTRVKMWLVGKLVNNPKVKARMGNAVTAGMLMPYRKLLDSIPESDTAENKTK